MEIELLVKVYLDSGQERFTADLPDTGVFVKVTDGIHARLVQPKAKDNVEEDV